MSKVSDNARWVMVSLQEQPDFNTPELITYNSPMMIQDIDLREVRAALKELEVAGLAVRQGGLWALTDLARSQAA